jgi:hypothetical protein
MAKQIDETDAHHQLSTADIRQKRLELTEHQRALQSEGAALYLARKGGPPPSMPLTDHDRRVSAHIRRFLNGSTPSQVLVPDVSRDEEIAAELAAIRFVDAELGRQYENALAREAEEWVRKNKTQWRELCREIVLTAVKLAGLEQRAREMLEPMPPWPVSGLAMGSSIGSGLSLLGYGDSLFDYREAALSEGLVTKREIAEAMANG